MVGGSGASCEVASGPGLPALCHVGQSRDTWKDTVSQLSDGPELQSAHHSTAFWEEEEVIYTHHIYAGERGGETALA